METKSIHDFSTKFQKWKDNPIHFAVEAKAKAEAEDKDDFIKVHKVCKLDWWFNKDKNRFVSWKQLNHVQLKVNNQWSWLFNKISEDTPIHFAFKAKKETEERWLC